jgi:hypothetical protein
MEFRIKNPIKDNFLPKNQFMIICTAESGDGDHEDEVELGPFDNNANGLKEMEETIKILDRMDEFLEENDCFVKSYDSLEGFKELIKWWPNDVTSDGECLAHFAGYDVFYYDINSKKCDVEVVE